MKVLILRSEDGNITKKDIVEGEFDKVLREIAFSALKEWNETSSDFTIMRDMYEVKIPLPLKPNVYEIIKGYLKSRTKTEAIAEIPVYIISFDNRWMDSDYRDMKVYVVSPYIDENVEKELTDYAIQATSQKPMTTEEEEEEEE
ncbi:DUF2286 domain-containing protein [Stygiolobus sp. CP850M]|jgi:hypothetical protein|uniref:DUF2286 domain-containing protein n=1 Tax=Stygiolobus sp. CP850M TaxID=3133134 RepID=UPI00307D3FCC